MKLSLGEPPPHGYFVIPSTVVAGCILVFSMRESRAGLVRIKPYTVIIMIVI